MNVKPKYKNTLEKYSNGVKSSISFDTDSPFTDLFKSIVRINSDCNFLLTFSVETEISKHVDGLHPIVMIGKGGKVDIDKASSELLFICDENFYRRSKEFHENEKVNLRKLEAFKKAGIDVYASHLSSSIGDGLLKNVDFSIQVMNYTKSIYVLLNKRMKRDTRIINAFLKDASANDIQSYCLKEDRITVAYELCKKYPLYESQLSAKLKERIGAMGLVEYVEKSKLKNSLSKEMDKKPEVKRMKI